MNSYISRVIEDASKTYSNQPEYIQALEEVLGSISVIFETHPEYEKNKVLERLIKPDHIHHFNVSYTKDNGAIEEVEGYRIQHNNLNGVYKGGLRFNPTVNESIIKALGFEQTFKNALTTLPMGGAKGGSNFDPKGKSDNEIKRFCYAFMEKLAPFIGEDVDVPAGDLGVGAREISYLYDAYREIKNSSETGFITGKPIEKGGSLARKEATGYGLVYFSEQLLQKRPIDSPRVIVSGAGNVAIYTALKARDLGYKVVGMSDSKGFVYDEDLDIDLIKQIKEVDRASLNKYPRGYHEGSIYDFDIKADIVFPCATQNEINLDRAKRLVSNGVKIVVEGANMPDDNDAINCYKENGIIIVPGKAGNAGGVSVSFLEMEQNRLNEKWTFEEVDKKLQSIMQAIYKQCVEAQKEYNIPYYDFVTAANIASATKLIKKISEEKNV